MADRSPGTDVEGGHGLVEQEKPRFGGQGPGHGHPLGLPTGELAGSRSRPVGQVHPTEPLAGPPVGIGP